MRNGSLMLLEVSFRSERDSARLAPEWTFEVMNVDMKSKLTGFGEDFIAYDTNAASIFCHAKIKIIKN